jgi:nucleotide-binding universal stress UspA family protein
MEGVLPLRRIVVGVNGSAASDAAVDWAVREASLRKAAVHLVCACHSDPRELAPYAPASWQARAGELRAAAQDLPDRTAEAARRRLPAGGRGLPARGGEQGP